MSESEGEMWAMAGGGILVNVHPASACDGRGCPIHHPSDHHMKDWPMKWRNDVGLMERICPHGIGHPDPDDLEHKRNLGLLGYSIHGCDGCCGK